MCEHARSMGGGKDDAVPIGFHYPVFSKLRGLLAKLQQELKPVKQHDRDHVAHITTLLQSEDLQKEEWSQFVHFLENRYTRHLVAHDENFTVLLLCWNKKQRSPIHDHSGSSCWVRVLEGAITERRFVQPNQESALDEIGCATVPAGGVCYINDSQGLHEMANESEHECTVTLHVYSPPYYYCNAFALDGQKRQVSMLAAAAPPREVVGLKTVDVMNELSALTSPTAPHEQMSLVQFAELLDDAQTPEEAITKAFDRVWLSQAEWATYAHFSDFRFQRLLIHQNDRYSLLLLCWLPNQRTPPHTHHGSSSWVRVLAGELTLTQEPSSESPMETKLRAKNSAFAEDSSLPEHVLANESKEFAVSLHLYNPPYTELHYGKDAKCPCPIFPHCGTTVRKHQCLPVVQCQRLGRLSRSLTPDDGCLTPTSDGSTKAGGVLTHLADLIDRIEGIFSCAVTCGDREKLSVAIMDALEGVSFLPSELERYWAVKNRNGGRVRLFESTTFNVALNLWEPGHKSVAHDHDGSQAWVKVLEGTLVDISYETTPDGRTQVGRNCTMATDDVVFYGPHSVHAMRNKSTTKRAATLHVYFGVCNSCRWFSLDDATRKPVKVSSQTAFAHEWLAFRNNRSGGSTPEGVLRSSS